MTADPPLDGMRRAPDHNLEAAALRDQLADQRVKTQALRTALADIAHIAAVAIERSR